jgi:hypothetical protein
VLHGFVGLPKNRQTGRRGIRRMLSPMHH